MLRLFLWIALVQSSFAQAQTFDVLIEESRAYDSAMFTNKYRFKSFTNTALVDGAVTSDGTDETVFDRSLINQTTVQGELPTSSDFSIRPTLFTQVAMRIEENEEEPRKISRTTWVEATPSLEFTYQTSSKVEILFGAAYHAIPDFEQKSETSSVETLSSYSSAAMTTYHLGLTKRLGSVGGGILYRAGAEGKRTIKKFTSQEENTELEFEDILYDPTTLTLFFVSEMGSGNFVFAEFSEVQASNGGNKTETGDPINENYTLARLSGFFSIGSPFNLKTTVVYKTLSYAENTNVTLDTIPSWGLHLKLVNGKPDKNTFIGIVYAYGRDGQSLPEFNASYKLDVYGVSLGLNQTF
ncbi:MAG: hypothetical protein AB7T49_18450 [Oligoflexales bacterium]